MSRSRRNDSGLESLERPSTSRPTARPFNRDSGYELVAIMLTPTPDHTMKTSQQNACRISDWPAHLCLWVESTWPSWRVDLFCYSCCIDEWLIYDLCKLLFYVIKCVSQVISLCLLFIIMSALPSYSPEFPRIIAS